MDKKKNFQNACLIPFFYHFNLDTRPFYHDDLCLVTLLKGMCLKFMKSPLQAEECFNLVIGRKSEIKRDTYLVPYAMFEKALLLKGQGNFQGASELMEKAK